MEDSYCSRVFTIAMQIQNKKLTEIDTVSKKLLTLDEILMFVSEHRGWKSYENFTHYKFCAPLILENISIDLA